MSEQEKFGRYRVYSYSFQNGEPVMYRKSSAVWPRWNLNGSESQLETIIFCAHPKLGGLSCCLVVFLTCVQYATTFKFARVHFFAHVSITGVQERV